MDINTLWPEAVSVCVIGGQTVCHKVLIKVTLSAERSLILGEKKAAFRREGQFI